MIKKDNNGSVFHCVEIYILVILVVMVLVGFIVAICNDVSIKNNISSLQDSIESKFDDKEDSGEEEFSDLVSDTSTVESSDTTSSVSDVSDTSLPDVSDVSSNVSSDFSNTIFDNSSDETREPLESSTSESTASDANTSEMLYTADEFKVIGVIRWNGWRWTWYTERILPGYDLKIPGRHNDTDGYVCDENDYICLASSTLKKGTIIDTSLGKQGKVYDAGCAKGTVDVYVNW